ncbi:hypothetical protein EMPG_10691 [Blastomyces silverae]|uniref:Amino acid permease/ SLC12A domain-containing protein n=1 Tax=Blastomyces silverae TaxID=2060906 RepID=A0A0H1B383_9EURO|nr:hypothetical protein EMPG_10691 [Blastomyces silverae]
MVAVSWITLAIALFCMPVSLPVTASTMNYASVVFAGFATISVVWYFVRARKEFTGPPIMLEGEDARESAAVIPEKISPHVEEGSGSEERDQAYMKTE